MEVLINKCFGGFSVSKKAVEDIGKLGDYLNSRVVNTGGEDVVYDDELRYNDALIKLYKEKGSEYISGSFAELELVEIPDEATDYKLYEYDGNEWVVYVLGGKLVEV